MSFYESVYIARPDISAAQVEALTQSLTAIVEENGGKVAKTEYWGVKSLAYRIKKNRKGHYSLLNLDAPPAALKEMERNMRLSEDIIRYISVRVDQLEEGPSIVMQNKSGRDGRNRDRGGGFSGGAAKKADNSGGNGKTDRHGETGKAQTEAANAPTDAGGPQTEAAGAPAEPGKVQTEGDKPQAETAGAPTDAARPRTEAARPRTEAAGTPTDAGKPQAKSAGGPTATTTEAGTET